MPLILLLLNRYCGFLFSSCYHDDSSTILLPDHPPEVSNGIGNGPLSCYIHLVLLIALERVGERESVGGRESE